MLVIDKQAMYEAICHAQNEEVQPRDYGVKDNDYEALWTVAMDNDQLCMMYEGVPFLDEGKYRVYLYQECGFDTPQELKTVWFNAKQSIEMFAESVGITLGV